MIVMLQVILVCEVKYYRQFNGVSIVSEFNKDIGRLLRKEIHSFIVLSDANMYASFVKKNLVGLPEEGYIHRNGRVCVIWDFEAELDQWSGRVRSVSTLIRTSHPELLGRNRVFTMLFLL